MSGVKRYNRSGDVRPDGHPDVCFVLAADYDTLQQRVEELEQIMSEPLKRLVTELDTLRARCAELYEAGNRHDAAHSQTIKERDALRAEVEALQTRLRRIEAVAECGSVQSWLTLPNEAKAQWFAMYLDREDERLALIKDAARIEFLAREARMVYGRKDEARYQLSELPELIQSEREECRPDDLRRAIDEAMEAAE